MDSSNSLFIHVTNDHVQTKGKNIQGPHMFITCPTCLLHAPHVYYMHYIYTCTHNNNNNNNNKIPHNLLMKKIYSLSLSLHSIITPSFP